MSADCSVFAITYEALARGTVTAKDKRTARVLWDASQNIDFNPDDLECDKALVRLGLARETKRGFEVRDGGGWSVWREKEEG